MIKGADGVCLYDCTTKHESEIIRSNRPTTITQGASVFLLIFLLKKL